MTATGAFAGLKTALFAVHGRTATLVANGARDPVTVCLMPNWNGAMTGGVSIDQIEPVAYIATTGAAYYAIANGDQLELGSDVYRVVASAADDMGMTKLTLAKT